MRVILATWRRMVMAQESSCPCDAYSVRRVFCTNVGKTQGYTHHGNDATGGIDIDQSPCPSSLPIGARALIALAHPRYVEDRA